MDDAVLIVVITLSVVVLFIVAVFVYATSNKKKKISSKEDLDKSITEKEDVFNLFRRILRAQRLYSIEELRKQITVQVPNTHKYSLMETIILRKLSRDKVKFSIKLRNGFPSFLSIVKTPLYASDGVHEFSIPELKENYLFYSDELDFWRAIFLKTELVHKLRSLHDSVEYLTIHKSHIETIMSDISKTIIFLDLITDVRAKMLEIHSEIYDVDIDVLYCYSCEDVFDPLEEKCDKCGAAKPRCIICFLDLRAIEEEVVELPCCGIYAHTNHILLWLRQKPICPNCRKDLTKWMAKAFLFELL